MSGWIFLAVMTDADRLTAAALLLALVTSVCTGANTLIGWLSSRKERREKREEEREKLQEAFRAEVRKRFEYSEKWNTNIQTALRQHGIIVDSPRDWKSPPLHIAGGSA